MSRRNNLDLREEYLHWLEPQLTDGNRSYWGILNLMFDTPFFWDPDRSVPMDDNRLQDGLDLRVEFAREVHIRPKTMDSFGDCSFLEVLVGLSRRLAFAAGGQAPGWAWLLFSNLDLHRLSDPLTTPKQRKAEEIMRVAMERTYAPDGTGGFFPLAWPDEDQTKVELWYQMNAFIEELHPEH